MKPGLWWAKVLDWIYLHNTLSSFLVSGVPFCPSILDWQMISALLNSFCATKDTILMTDTSPPSSVTSLVSVLERTLFPIFQDMVAAGLVYVDWHWIVDWSPSSRVKPSVDSFKIRGTAAGTAMSMRKLCWGLNNYWRLEFLKSNVSPGKTEVKRGKFVK